MLLDLDESSPIGLDRNKILLPKLHQLLELQCLVPIIVNIFPLIKTINTVKVFKYSSLNLLIHKGALDGYIEKKISRVL